MNPILAKALSADIKRAIETAKVLHTVQHAGTRGRIREILISELLRPLLPKTFSIMTGILVDHAGNDALNQSGQEDIIIFSREIMAGGMLFEETGLLPIEACLAVIEVKSTIKADGIKQSIKHAGRIKKSRTVYEHDRNVDKSNESVKNSLYPFYNVLAFGTDLVSGVEWERIAAFHSELGFDTPQISNVCVVGSGMAMWNKTDLKPSTTASATEDYNEVVAFVSITSDMARSLRQSKLMLPLPKYSLYFFGRV